MLFLTVGYKIHPHTLTDDPEVTYSRIQQLSTIRSQTPPIVCL